MKFKSFYNHRRLWSDIGLLDEEENWKRKKWRGKYWKGKPYLGLMGWRVGWVNIEAETFITFSRDCLGITREASFCLSWQMTFLSRICLLNVKTIYANLPFARRAALHICCSATHLNLTLGQMCVNCCQRETVPQLRRLVLFFQLWYLVTLSSWQSKNNHRHNGRYDLLIGLKNYLNYQLSENIK